MQSCRICLQAADPDLGEFLRPCRCKDPVHRKCLDAWRASGINPANITRCEVCHYHYRLASDVKTWQVHFFVYAIALVQIVLFLALSVAAGFMIRATKFADLIDWGRLSFMKPDTNRGWIFLGCCFVCFCIGVAATLVLLYRLVWRRNRRPAPARRSPWMDAGLQSRNRRHDCCRDCCYTTDSDSCLLFCYVCCSGPDCYCPCEACCYTCDVQTARCCDVGGCCSGCGCSGCDCGSCCDGDAGPFVLILGVFAAVIAVVLILIGMFVFFWVIFYNVFNAIAMNHTFLHSAAAQRYCVLPYDAAHDAVLPKSYAVDNPWTLQSVAAPVQQGMPASNENAQVVGKQKVEPESLA